MNWARTKGGKGEKSVDTSETNIHCEKKKRQNNVDPCRRSIIDEKRVRRLPLGKLHFIDGDLDAWGAARIYAIINRNEDRCIFRESESDVLRRWRTYVYVTVLPKFIYIE